jgi:biotin operon repressor/predicted phosphodiesterase
MVHFKRSTDLTPKQIEETVNVWKTVGGNVSEMARIMGLSRTAASSRIEKARRLGLDMSIPAPTAAKADDKPLIDGLAMRRILRMGHTTVESLAQTFKTTPAEVVTAIQQMRAEGFAIQESGDSYWLITRPQSGTDLGHKHEYKSRADGSYVFGWLSDTHLGSKYSRLDVLNKLFDAFAEVGVDRVFHAGNWIDGEAHFNKHDLLVHGMDAQCRYLAENWPKRDGITTYAVTGDDHEGWYSQREGVDIGRYAEMKFRDVERRDWVDLGYMEADIALTHAESGVKTRLRVAHPGGGSSYATSYAPQKYIESLDGGEKPAVVLLGHWHKMECINIRNVWVIQTGCTQDQTPFGRKKRLDFHVGGGITRLVQDPDTGAITRCTVDMMRFFNREHYGSGRWSHHEDVTMAPRTPY